MDSIRTVLTQGRRGSDSKDLRTLIKRNADRLANYDRYMRLFDGVILRTSENGSEQVKDIAFALAGPIVTAGADFLAGSPIVFTVRNSSTGEPDKEATKAAAKIWSRSGGESEFLPAAIKGGIYGDVPIVIRQNSRGEVYLDFTSADFVFPVFSRSDKKRLTSAVIAFQSTDEQGEKSNYYEEYSEDGTWYINDAGKELQGSFDTEIYDGGIPVLWIRNLGLGEQFGRSDLRSLKRILERYDHASEKELDIIDYYSSPHVISKGAQISQIIKDSIPFGFRRLFSIGKDDNIEYLEWKGNRPDVEKGLEHVRQTISEVSEVPSIAFGHTPPAMTQMSGVALKILYGPLLAKTRRKRADYGPVLERAMCFALRQAGFPIESELLVDIAWSDPTPINELEKWEVANAKHEAGLSRAQALREAGYDDEQIAKIMEERSKENAEDAESAMSAFDAGNVPTDERATNRPPED